MFKQTVIASFSLLLLAGCRSDHLQKELHSSETIGFSIGANREQVFDQLKTMKAKILKDGNDVVLVEVPVKHPVMVKLTFDQDKLLEYVTYSPVPE